MQSKTPWSAEQINSLNSFQKCGRIHPFTCGNDKCRSDLIATPSGWICPNCPYTQDWAHDFMISFPKEKFNGPA